MARYVAVGTRMNYTSEAELKVGTVVSVGDIVGVAEAGCTVGEECALTIKGVFALVASSNISQGTIVYIDAEQKATAAKGENHRLGVAMNAAVVGSEVFVKINM